MYGFPSIIFVILITIICYWLFVDDIKKKTTTIKIIEIALVILTILAFLSLIMISYFGNI